MIMNWLVTLLVATVPTDRDNSGRFQTDVWQVEGLPDLPRRSAKSHGMQEARGSNLLSSTGQRHIAIL